MIKQLISIFVLLSIFCYSNTNNFKLFPKRKDKIYKSLVIDPLHPSSYIGINMVGKKMLISIGDSISFVNFNFGEYSLQIGLEGNVWMIFINKPQNFPIETLDFLIAMPIDFKVNDFVSIRLKYMHISGHYSDEVEIEKTKNSVGFSRDRLVLGYILNLHKNLRYYGQIHYHTIMHPKGNPFVFTQGIEFNIKEKTFSPFSGFDLKILEDNEFVPNMNIQVGVAINRGRGAKIVLEYYTGQSLAGKLFRTRENNLNLKIIF